MQANEAQELNATLKREHASKLTELTNRTNRLEEENFLVKEEASGLSQEIAALVKERNSLALEKKDLESQIEDAQKVALAAKSRVRMFHLSEIFMLFCLNGHDFYMMSCFLLITPVWTEASPY